MTTLRAIALRRRRRDDVEEDDRSQDQGPHFARACTIKMHADISQEPFCARIPRKNAGAHDREPHFASLRSRNALAHVRRAILCENLEVKCRRPAGAR